MRKEKEEMESVHLLIPPDCHPSCFVINFLFHLFSSRSSSPPFLFLSSTSVIHPRERERERDRKHEKNGKRDAETKSYSFRARKW